MSFQIHSNSIFLKTSFIEEWSGSTIASTASVIVWWWCGTFNGSGKSFFNSILFYKSLVVYRIQIWCCSVRYGKRNAVEGPFMQSKVKNFLLTQPWWSAFKISFAIIFVRKTSKSLLESYIEPCTQTKTNTCGLLGTIRYCLLKFKILSWLKISEIFSQAIFSVLVAK